MNFESGLDKTRLVANILMFVLLVGNIFFSIQYAYNVQRERELAALPDTSTTRIQIARFLKYYIDTVLDAKGAISLEARVKLENDIRQIKDADLIKQWDIFVASKGGVEAQQNAVKLMSLLTNKML